MAVVNVHSYRPFKGVPSSPISLPHLIFRLVRMGILTGRM